MIPNFPMLALSVGSLPLMLSQNFEHMFDFSLEGKCLRIVKTKGLKLVLELPKDMITSNNLDNEVDSIREVFAKVRFSRKQDR